MGYKQTREGKPQLPEVGMRYVGIDLHKRSMTVCVIDKSQEKPFVRRFHCSEEAKVLAFFETLCPFQATVEASATYQWLWELLEPLADRLVLAHPKKIRIIAESMKKTDREDARFLAWLLSHDSLPEAHCPTPRQREYQLLVKHRHSLVRTRSRVKTQIRSLLAARNLDHKRLFTEQGRVYLSEISLSAAERFRIEELLKLHDTLKEQVVTSEKRLVEFRKEASEAQKRNHDIVTSVPGFGNLIGDVVLSSLGDVRRFSCEQKATAYSGLVPGFRQSDKTRRDLHITKEGPRILRWALIQAAWRATFSSKYWKRIFESHFSTPGAEKGHRGGRSKASGGCL